MAVASTVQLLRRYKAIINLGLSTTNLGMSIWSQLKQDPNNPQLLAELQRLVNTAEFNNEVGHHFSESSLVISKQVRLIG
jgi:hypothetical protein